MKKLIAAAFIIISAYVASADATDVERIRNAAAMSFFILYVLSFA